MAHQHLWTEDAEPPVFSSLAGDLDSEIVIVGGGITGLMTAYILAKAGKKPVVLEKDEIGHGETACTTAFLTSYIDVTLAELKRKLGKKRARQVLETGEKSIDLLEKIVREQRIECEFMRCPLHVFALNQKDAGRLKKEAGVARALGYAATFRENGLPFESFGYLEIPNQAKFHPQKFLNGLAQNIIKLGGSIYARTTVVKFGGKHGNVLTTDKGVVTAHHVVVATHSPIDNAYECPTRMVGYQSYVVAADAPAGSIPDGLYLDTDEPYHYLRVDALADRDRILLGGEDHVTGRAQDADQRFKRLEKQLGKFLGKTAFEVTHRWSGIVLETPDMLPYIGRSALNKHHFIATGYAGNGMTFGTAAAMIISDDLLGKRNAWAGLYTSKRVRGLWNLTRSGLNVGREWISGFFRKKPAAATKLKPGEGKILTIGGKALAVSCTASGTCTAVSAVCTHLGCHVQWNPGEKTWDCPCHASRFRPTGEVINGPAIKPLERFPDIEKKLGK